MNHLLYQSRPITGIQVTEENIFICEGPGLSVYSVGTVSKLCQKVVFPSQKTVQGLSVFHGEHGDLVCLYGRSYWSIVRYDRAQNIVSEVCNSSSSKELVTYIAARWLKCGRQLAAVTDENILHIFSWNSNESNKFKSNIQRVDLRGVQTTLFSSTLAGDSADDLVVFSGTNLSQVYVWAACDNRKTHHLLIEGIKGSVLSLKYNSDNQVLVASSDQRSVFAWKIITKPDALGSSLSNALVNGGVAVSLIAEMLGHTGRVWDVDLSLNHIVSAGQDSKLLLWDMKGKLLKAFTGQSVISLRSCSFSADGNFVVCGSDDSSLTLWRVADHSSVYTVNLTEEGDNRVYPKQVLLHSPNEFLVTLSSGEFLLVTTAGRKERVFEDPTLTSYSVSAYSADRQHLAVGNKNGLLYILLSRNFEKCQTMEFDSKIVSIHWVDSDYIILATYVTAYGIKNYNASGAIENEGSWKVTSTFSIPWKDKPGVSSAIKLEAEGNMYFILGDECGALHLFYENCSKPVFSLPKVHGSYGVCDLKRGSAENELWSVGRNRCIMNLKIQGDRAELICVQSVDSCLNWNSRLIETSLGSFLCGFSENEFVVVDLLEDYTVKTFSCGGAHRSWDVAINDVVSFAFIRRKELTVAKLELDSRSVKSGIFGGRTINVVSVCPSVTNDSCTSKNNVWLLTGGEDCLLRLSSVVWCSTYNRNEGCCSVWKLGKFKGHASSVRVIKWLKWTNSSLLVISGGGRSQIIASHIQSFSKNLVWAKKASISLQSCSSSNSEYGDLDMRIMDLSLNANENPAVQVLSACSDGFLRLLELNEKFTVIRTFNQTSSDPAASIMHAVTRVSSLSDLSCWTTSSGDLVLSESRDFSERLHIKRTNEAAVTAMTVVSLPGGEQFVVTGCDDGILKVFQVLRDDNDFMLNLYHQDTDNHHAAINAVKECNGLIFAASADQVVTVRNITGSKVKKFICGVSDIQDLAVDRCKFSESSLLLTVVGQGLEMHNFDAMYF